MTDSKINEIKRMLAKESRKNNVLLAYFFGSQLKGKTGPLSDYDFAQNFAPIAGFRNIS